MMKNTVIINNHVYTLVPYKTEEELNKLRNICGYGYGYCACGCGEKISPVDCRGRKRLWVRGHNRLGIRGPEHQAWKGGRLVTTSGYILIWNPSHQSADKKGYVAEHITVMEDKIGRKLNVNEVVHHIDGDKQNNHPDNLELFTSNSDHATYEHRMRACKESGNSHWRKCALCHKYDDPKNLVIRENAGAFHRQCMRDYHKTRKAEIVAAKDTENE